MIKPILVLLVVFGFLMGNPSTRSRIASAAQPALEKLGPVGRVVMRPFRGFTANTEVKFIGEQIKLAKELGRELPTERTFQDWIRTRAKTRNDGNDPWGAPYYLTRGQQTMTVGSAGADGQPKTADDITYSVPY